MDRAAFNQKRHMGPSDLQPHEPTVRSIAGGFGMVLKIHNDGQHWEFKKPGLLVDWWPSSGSTMVNKHGGRKTKVFTIDELRKVLTQDAAKAPRMPGKFARRTKDSGAEFVPSDALLCVDCRKPGAMPFNQKCGGCAFGALRFAR